MNMEDNKAKRHEDLMAMDPSAVADMLVAWETEISKVMPADYKDWWQNSRAEWPVVARMNIESLREREQLAWDMVEWEGLTRPIEMITSAFTIKGK